MDDLIKYIGYDVSLIKESKLVLFGTLILLIVVYNIVEMFKLKNELKKNNTPGPITPGIIENLKIYFKGIPKYDQELIKKYGKIVKSSFGGLPFILTTDPKFIKAVMIKDFDYFRNRRIFEALLVKPFDKMMSLLKDEEWKSVRSHVTPTLTSGKLKSMSKTMIKCVDNFEAYLEDLVEKDGILDAKTYSLDVVSNCGFGVNVNSIKEPNNPFLKNLQNLSSFASNSKLLLLFLFPKLSTFLTKFNIVEILPTKTIDYIQDVLNQIIEKRKNGTEKREDFIQYMVDHEDHGNTGIDSTNGEIKASNAIGLKKNLTNDEILSQAVLFLSAGYDTVERSLSFITYNLAINPEYQEELCEEVDSILEKYDGQVSYESVSEMKFMDMMIDETLRLYPFAQRIDRIANDDYEYNGIKIKKGTAWGVCVSALHLDPEIYPDPEKFNPYRFDEDSKKMRENTAYLPFGGGPRNCVGMRFALIEIKLLLAKVLSKYKFVKCSETPVPLVLRPFQPIPIKPIKVKVEKRF